MPPSDKKKLGHKDALNKGDKLTQELLAKSLCKDAHASKCIWARVKGYPWWPVSSWDKHCSVLIMYVQREACVSLLQLTGAEDGVCSTISSMLFLASISNDSLAC